MNRYYANCSLVIQASGTESVSDSFLDLAHRSRNRGVFESIWNLSRSSHPTAKRILSMYALAKTSTGIGKAISQPRFCALGSCHAGLWSHFAPAGLLWRSTRPASPDAEFSVPSWSWAAVRSASYPDSGKPIGASSGGVNFKDVDVQLSSFVSVEEGGDEVKQISIVTKLLDVWWGPDTTPQQEPRKRLSQQEGAGYALFQDGEVLTKEVYPDHPVDLPPCGRQSMAMMLGRRYVGGVEHDQDQDHHGEVLLLRKRENGTYVRTAFAELLFKDFQEIWEPRFKVETIVLA